MDTTADQRVSGTACTSDHNAPAHDQTRRQLFPEDADVDPTIARANRILRGLGFCGHYMHFHGGGRSGRGPILCLLAQHGGQMSQQELGSFFELKPGSLSEILAKIETAGLIERTRDPKDRRQLFIHLTDDGYREADREQRARESFRNQAFTCLTPEEQEALAVMLEKIRTRWEELA